MHRGGNPAATREEVYFGLHDHLEGSRRLTETSLAVHQATGGQASFTVDVLLDRGPALSCLATRRFSFDQRPPLIPMEAPCAGR
mgnify:CR=1 FL=1